MAALADAGRGRLVAFFIYRAAWPRFASIEAELRRAFAGAGWLVPTLLDLLPRADAVYADEVAQIVMPRWREERTVLIGDAAHAVSLVAGKGATLAMAGGCFLADALADRPDDADAATARYEAWIRPMVEAAQRWRGATFSSSRPRTAPSSCCARRRCGSPRCRFSRQSPSGSSTARARDCRAYRPTSGE